jgi:hypothetical protein
MPNLFLPGLNLQNLFLDLPFLPFLPFAPFLGLTGTGTGLFGPNFGFGNLGSFNFGNGNTGDFNILSGNTGGFNFGGGNIGSGNTGNQNYGFGNIGTFNIGFATTALTSAAPRFRVAVTSASVTPETATSVWVTSAA